MKQKAVFTLLALLALVLAAVLLFPLPLFCPAEIESSMALEKNGTASFAQNGAGTSIIYRIDNENRLLSVYREKNRTNGEATAISHLAAGGGFVYFIRQCGPEASGLFERWELARLDVNSNTAETLWRSHEKAPAVCALSEDGGALYLASAGETKSGGAPAPFVSLLRLSAGDEKPEPILISTTMIPNRQAISAVAYTGENSVCALLADGSVLRCSGGGAVPLNLSGFGPMTALTASNRFLWMYNAQNETVVYGVGSRFHSINAPAGVLSGGGTGVENMLLRASNENGAVLLRLSASASFEAVNVAAPPQLRFSARLPLVAAAEGAVLAAAFLLWLFIRLVVRGRRLSLRLGAVYAFTALALCAAAFGAVVYLACGLQNEAALAEAAAAKLVYMGASGEAQYPDGSFAFYAAENGASLPVAYRGVTGSETPAVRRLVRGAFENGGGSAALTTVYGRRAAVSALPCERSGVSTGVLVHTVVTPDLFVLTRATLQTAALSASALLFSSFLVFWVLTRKVTRPLKEITSQMDALSEGSFTQTEITCTDDEIGRMWRSMREMSVSLGIRDYETRSTLESCRRFVPRGLDRLLGFGNITEIRFGDSAALAGEIGFIAVKGDEALRGRLNDDQFMNFVNHTFSVISKNTRPCGGVLLTAGFDLKAIKVLYPGGAGDGLTASLSLLGEKTSFSVGVLPPPEFFVLLHSTRFLYGIAGAEDEAFPYIASSEMNFFSGRLGQFALAGCRLAVTGEYKSKLAESCSTRYLGFISSADKQLSYQIFEVLESYNPLEKRRREQYDAKFQEAIAKFYKNDFYLARGLFLAILRTCPGDGVARWYLFTCEHYFNNASDEEPDYSLFGFHGKQ